MFNKWIVIGCILSVFVAVGFALFKVKQTLRLQEMLQEQRKTTEQLQLDASLDRKTWDEVYRACIAENVLLREKLKECN